MNVVELRVVTKCFEPRWRRRAPHFVSERLPRIAAYLASERRMPLNQDGIFRCYPELDAD